MYRRYQVTIGNPHFSDATSSYQVRKYVHSAYDYAQKMLEENPRRCIRIADREANRIVFLVESGELLIDELTEVVKIEPRVRKSRSWFRNLLKEPKQEVLTYTVETFNRRTGKVNRTFEVDSNAYSFALNAEEQYGFMYVEIKCGGEVVYESNYEPTLGHIVVHTDRLSPAA